LILLNAPSASADLGSIPAVVAVVKTINFEALYEKLLVHYGIVGLGPFAQGDKTTDFLVQVARKRGRLGKGGVPELELCRHDGDHGLERRQDQGWVRPPVLKVRMMR